MKVLLRFFALMGLFLLGQQAFALSCAPPPENPFETTDMVFLAQVTEDTPDVRSGNTQEAPIRIVKVYKGDIAKIRATNPMIRSSDWLGRAHIFAKGEQFLLYGAARIGKCNFVNRQTDTEEMVIFEKKYPPIWVHSDIR